MLFIIMVVISIGLILDNIIKQIHIDVLKETNDNMIKELKQIKRENDNLMAVIENDDKVIKEMKEGKY